MCELCELCELLERKIPSRKRWDFLIYPQQNLFVGFGLFRRSLMSDIVRLLERAEESCEGLKHGYYDLPCVHFLIFLCHDIKNKIDRLFFKKNKISQNFPKLFFPETIRNARSAWNARKALLRSLYCLLAGDIISVLLSANGTAAGQARGYWSGGLRSR